MKRRQLLGGAAAYASFGALVASCDFLSAEPDAEEQTTSKSSDEKEAPELAEAVKAGDLPPLEDRLPDEPVVVEPVERVGVYGGTWRTATTGTADWPWLGRTIGYETPIRYDLQTGELHPNVLESFERNDDGTEFTIRTRAGLKWSDGAPYSADDIMFWFEDVLGNEELSPTGVPSWMMANDEPPVAEKLDDRTIKFTFAGPYGLWLQTIATEGQGRQFLGLPRHYLEQFHKDYATDLDALVQEAGVPDWIELFGQRKSPWENADLPSLQAWKIGTPLADGSQAVAERNPYYWKTDPDGRQLPYIDRIVYEYFTDAETILTRGLAGELSMHSRHFNTGRNKPVIAQSRESGDYRFFNITPEQMNTGVISFNLTHQDPVKNEIFNQKDFRVGLSHAINRAEIIQAVFQSQGEPYQAAPRPESEFYDEEFAKQYTEFDPAIAAEHLDRVLPDVDGDGLRLGPDGERFTFGIAAATGFRQEDLETLEMVRGYWLEVGIDANIQPQDRSLFDERVAGNEHDAVIWWGDGGGVDILQRPRFYVPIGGNNRVDYAVAWAEWYQSGGTDGEEPPEVVRGYMDLYDQIRASSDQDEQRALMNEIIAGAKEEFYVIGINLEPDGYGIVKNDFHNVPDPITGSVLFGDPGNSQPAHYFISE